MEINLKAPIHDRLDSISVLLIEILKESLNEFAVEKIRSDAWDYHNIRQNAVEKINIQLGRIRNPQQEIWFDHNSNLGG
jgi:hypothetical protein